MKRFKDTPYFVTKDGRVFRNDRELQPELSRGYHRVSFSIKGKVKRYLVHRLVAKIYIDNPDNKKYVNHINHIRADNRVENLEWVTHSENMIHCVKHGRGTNKLATQKSVENNDVRMIQRLQDKLGCNFVSTYKEETTEKRKRSRRFVEFICFSCGNSHVTRSDSSLMKHDMVMCPRCNKSRDEDIV